jgi:hypothetical protein
MEVLIFTMTRSPLVCRSRAEEIDIGDAFDSCFFSSAARGSRALCYLDDPERETQGQATTERAASVLTVSEFGRKMFASGTMLSAFALPEWLMCFAPRGRTLKP